MTAQRTTILQIIPQLDTGGAELSTLEITEAVVRAGGRMLVLSEGGRLAGEIGRLGGELIEFPAATKNPVRMLANAGRITALVRREGVDLVHARSRAPAWSALLAARRAGIPFVTTYHGAYAESGRLKNLYNSVMARADLVIANSCFTADLVAARYGTPAARIRVIHRGVDLKRFDPDAVAPCRLDELRARWGVRTDQPVVLHAARLTGWKGQHVVIEAAALLQRQGRLGPAAVVLAGDDQGRQDYTARLKARMEEAGLTGSVRIVGHCDDMAAAFLLADVAVVASTEPEAFGRAATEAQAMGCPVIATDLGAPPETMLSSQRVGPDAITGWLVAPGDPGGLADRIAEALFLPPAELAAMRARARAHVAANFSLERMKSATLEVYDQLLGTSLAASLIAGPANH